MKKKRYASRLVNPAPTSESVRKAMVGNRAKNTKPEIALRQSLWKIGMRGYRIHPSLVEGRPDLVFKSAKVAIFINGCFWHRCPSCCLDLPKSNRAFWIKKFRRNVSRDRRKERALIKQGWQVVIIWECQIKRSLHKVTTLLASKVRARRKAIAQTD